MSLQMHFVAGDGFPCSARLRAREQSPDEGEDSATGPGRTAKTVSYKSIRRGRKTEEYHRELFVFIQEIKLQDENAFLFQY